MGQILFLLGSRRAGRSLQNHTMMVLWAKTHPGKKGLMATAKGNRVYSFVNGQLRIEDEKEVGIGTSLGDTAQSARRDNADCFTDTDGAQSGEASQSDV